MRQGRPKGTRLYDINVIYSVVCTGAEVKTTNSITTELKKIYPQIHGLTVLTYLKELEKREYIEEIYKSKNRGRVRIWKVLDDRRDRHKDTEIHISKRK